MRYWLSFDLGLRGNYEDLYAWLDSKSARECGDSIATFSVDLTPEQLKLQLDHLFNSNSRARIYLIHNREGRLHGEFIIGGRKRAPWSGFAEDIVVDEEEE